MQNTYRGGYTKSYIDVKDWMSRKDLWYYKTYDKDSHTGVRGTLYTKKGFISLLTFMRKYSKCFMANGKYTAFGIRVGGELYMDDNSYSLNTHNWDDATYANEFVNGYEGFIEDVLKHLQETHCRLFGQKHIVHVLDEVYNIRKDNID